MFWLSELNEEQKEAATTTEGYVRVIAVPGSGKTRALTSRYVHLVKALGIPQNNIMCVTFTNKAANTMKSRIRKMIPDQDVAWIGTFHGLCKKILDFDINLLNFPKTYKIIDTEDRKTLLREICAENNIKLENATFKTIIKLIDEYKRDHEYVKPLTAPQYIGDYEGLDKNKKYSFVIREYLRLQRRNYYLDFNDLINFVLYLLNTNADFREKWQNQFEYIQVDEFQDVSKRQYALCTILADKHKNLFVVGDPDQNIYSWRGARADFLLLFDDFFGCKTIYMQKNYRSSKQIALACNALIKNNTERLENQIYSMANEDNVLPLYYHAKTEREEAEFIAKQIKSEIENGIEPKEIAVLYRANQMSRAIEEALLKEKIAYQVYSGTAFYERAIIKDLLAYTKMAISQDDASFLRTYNIPRRGIGQKKLEYLKEYRDELELTYYEALKLCVNDHIFSGCKAKEYVDLIETAIKHSEKMNALELFDFISKESGYEKLLMEDGDQDNLDLYTELKNSIKFYVDEYGEKVGLQQYLNDLALLTSGDNQEIKNCVKLMTAHSAKGLEFEVVFVCKLVEGGFPSSRVKSRPEMEEERRLFYVACTRAKDKLFLTNFKQFNSSNEAATSRFIYNVTYELVDKQGEFEEKHEEYSKNYIQMMENREKGIGSHSDNEFTVGDKVKHSTFGIGIIRSANDNGYTVEFENIVDKEKENFKQKDQFVRAIEDAGSSLISQIVKNSICICEPNELFIFVDTASSQAILLSEDARPFLKKAAETLANKPKFYRVVINNTTRSIYKGSNVLQLVKTGNNAEND